MDLHPTDEQLSRALGPVLDARGLVMASEAGVLADAGYHDFHPVTRVFELHVLRDGAYQVTHVDAHGGVVSPALDARGTVNPRRSRHLAHLQRSPDRVLGLAQVADRSV